MSEMAETNGAFWGKLTAANACAVAELRSEKVGTETVHPADILENAVAHSWALFGKPVDAESVIFFHDRLDLGAALPLHDTPTRLSHSPSSLPPQRLAEASEEDLARDLKEYARRASRHETQRLLSNTA